MPFDPNTPRSRDEVLLQAIVSGDSSAMGDPRDREEEFVKAIADKETLPDYSEASEGDVLQIGADGPEWGNAGGGVKYVHNINIYCPANLIHYNLNLIITNSIPTALTANDIITYLSENISGTKYYPCSGGHYRNDSFVKGTFNYICIESISETTLTIRTLFHNDTDNTSSEPTHTINLSVTGTRINDFVE